MAKRIDALAQDADNEYAMIDSTIVRAHQPVRSKWGSEKRRFWRSRGGLSTKIKRNSRCAGQSHAFHHTWQIADLGKVLTFCSKHTLKKVPVIADKGYDAQAAGPTAVGER